MISIIPGVKSNSGIMMDRQVFDEVWATFKRRDRSHEARICHGCGEERLDVDQWAESSDTGEEIWLCSTCGEW